MRRVFILVLALMVANTPGLASEPSIASTARLTPDLGYGLVASGRMPRGASSTQPYWVFGGNRPFAETREELANRFRASGWDVHMTEGPLRPGDLSMVASLGGGVCLGYFELRQGGPAVDETMLNRIEQPDQEALARVAEYPYSLFITDGTCG